MITAKEARIATDRAESMRKELENIEYKIKQRAHLGYYDVAYECEIISVGLVEEVVDRLREFGFSISTQPYQLLKMIICWRTI